MSFATYNINAQLDAKALTMAATAVDTPEPGYVTVFTDASERLAVKRDNGFVAALNMPVTVDTVYTFPTGGAALSLVDTTIASLPSLTTAASLSTVGTIGTGIWQAGVISPTYGGTGFNNGSNTIQLAGSLTTAGANPLTLTTTGPTTVTLPTTGTLVNTAVTALNSLASAPALATVGTITTGVWNGTDIAVADGGTGVSTLAAGGLLYGNGTSPVGVSAIGTSGQLLVSGGSGAPSWSGTITYASNKLTGLAAPSANSDAANKQYVDETVAGLSWKTAARASTTAALTVTYNNGVSGVGATLTNNDTLAALVLDGVSLAVNDRVLVKNQASALQNGIYVVTTVGSGAIAWVLTRAVDADNSPVNELNSAAIFVSEGSVGANRSWTQTTASVVVGTSNIVWSQFAGTNTYTASAGISLVGNDFQITSPLANIYGGTGFNTYANGDLLYGSSPTSLTKLAAGTANQVLHSGATPSWSAVSLTADVSGVLPVANGGTNSSTALNGLSLIHI